MNKNVIRFTTAIMKPFVIHVLHSFYCLVVLLNPYPYRHIFQLEKLSPKQNKNTVNLQSLRLVTFAL